MSEKRQIPIAEGLWTKAPDGSVRLVGSKCKDCGKVSFPTRGACPICFNQNLEEILLENRGKVQSCTVYRFKGRQPPGYIGGVVPFSVGFVILPEGAGVQTDFSGYDMAKELDVGTEVALGLKKLTEDDSGNEIITYTFRPV